MATVVTTVYGKGGHDPSKPNNNVVEELEVDVPGPEASAEERITALETEVAGIKSRAAKVADTGSVSDVRDAVAGA